MAAFVAACGAQAADMPVKAQPVQYVKICSLYGDGFYYIPGTDTCRGELNVAHADFRIEAGIGRTRVVVRARARNALAASRAGGHGPQQQSAPSEDCA
jgi:hypothetical protein